ncbi:hypothetical protein RR48_00018 [Papilio machaon]|uniref:DUF4746 domain-containing protein n=1 Tax=Papilio machaon TaxID=76193 RepID=A0A0N1II76_PAPMA|nr:hypothetical protein RR48_00018 [Papilio machaon]
MVSRKRSNALLTLAGLNPCYISSDLESGERDCLAMFPVGYGDEYVEEESVVEEEQVVVRITVTTLLLFKRLSIGLDSKVCCVGPFFILHV